MASLCFIFIGGSLKRAMTHGGGSTNTTHTALVQICPPRLLGSQDSSFWSAYFSAHPTPHENEDGENMKLQSRILLYLIWQLLDPVETKCDTKLTGIRIRSWPNNFISQKLTLHKSLQPKKDERSGHRCRRLFSSNESSLQLLVPLGHM
jgi:hypothetical protein